MALLIANPASSVWRTSNRFASGIANMIGCGLRNPITGASASLMILHSRFDVRPSCSHSIFWAEYGLVAETGSSARRGGGCDCVLPNTSRVETNRIEGEFD